MFIVRIADNFHRMDEDNEAYDQGEFATWDEAVAVAQAVVDGWLAEQHVPGMDAATLLSLYRGFGEDPHITPVPKGEGFSAWSYAERRCSEICAPAQSADSE